MKTRIVVWAVIFVFSFAFPTYSLAQSVKGFPSSSPDNATIQSQQQEEQEGKKLVDDLSNKTVTCPQLKDADFEKIGEYFMGKMVGSSHEAMNTMMGGMMGKEGEEQMHIAIGKRMSNCQPDAPVPANMMGGMMTTVMGSGGGNMPWIGRFGLLFGIYSIIFSVLILVVLVLLTIWLWKQIQKK